MWEQKRETACQEFVSSLGSLSPGRQDAALWEILMELQGEEFHTAKQLKFTYAIRGGEMFVDRKEKSLTQSTVYMAFHKALELGGMVSGPKKLGTFGASYLYPVFAKIGIIKTGEKII